MYSRKARHQLQYHSDDADDNSCEEEKEPETPMQPAKREKLIVKIPIPIKTKSEPKKTGRGKGVRGGKSARARGRGRGHGRGCNTSSENSTNGVSVTAPARPRGRRGRGRGQQQKSYQVPNYVAVVKDNKSKGYVAPSGDLAMHLAKYFEEKTEIEYDVIVSKMADVPEEQILEMLGIKPKKTDGKTEENGKQPEANNSEDEREAEELMKELSEKSETEKVETKEAGNKVENGENKAAGNKVESLKQTPPDETDTTSTSCLFSFPSTSDVTIISESLSVTGTTF